MITITDKFKEWIDSFGNQEKAADFLGISRPHLNAILSGANVGGEFIELVKEKTGWDWEKAFRITEDKDVGK